MSARWMINWRFVEGELAHHRGVARMLLPRERPRVEAVREWRAESPTGPPGMPPTMAIQRLDRTTGPTARAPRRPADARSTSKAPALIMGLGFGGFIDGILLHQILQWHHMLTSTAGHPMTTVAGLETNTLVDGFFHLATWILVAVGSWLMLRAWQEGQLAPTWRAHLGLLLAGWGIFNVVEGLIDHQILGIHHVRDDLGGPIGWDLSFLALGVGLIVVGLAMARSATRQG